MLTTKESIIILVGCTISPIKLPIQIRDYQGTITAIIKPQLTGTRPPKNSQSKQVSLFGITGQSSGYPANLGGV
ncbi:hypothetical protein RI528_00215 [Aeromonas veronii]|uniref:hypothetical protein n=1 Tax=Aeromonas TaxID=642 RepID=UPI00343E805C